MRRSLRGKTIVVTRPSDGRDALARDLKRAGASVIAAPAIRIVRPGSWGGLDKALRALASFDAVIFTSANAVAAFFGRARTLRLGALVKPARLYAIGPATRAALEARGWTGAREPSDRRAEGLSRLFGSVRGWRVLIPRAERARELLPAALRRRGAAVTVATAYRTRAHRSGLRRLKALAASPVDAVAFTSASSVDAAAGALGKAGMRRLFSRARAAAIGPVTAQALRRRGVANPICAARASAAELVKALARELA